MGLLKALGVLSGLALAIYLIAVEFEMVEVKLRSPPALPGQTMQPPPPGALPWAFDSSFRLDNQRLRGAVRHFEGIVGVETVVVSPNGTVALFDERGQLFLADPVDGLDFTTPRYVTTLPTGRPLGARYDPWGNLIICHAPGGLLQLTAGATEPAKLLAVAYRVSPQSKIAPGAEVTFANTADVAADGTVYFSHSTNFAPFKQNNGIWNVMESVYVNLASGRPTGLLLKYEPRLGLTTALADGLWFANGVALSKGEDFVVVAESLQARLLRHWLKGPKAGTTEVFAANLPGAPDGVLRASDGGFWVSIIERYPPIIRLAGSRVVRMLVGAAPPALRPPAAPFGLVLKLSPDGATEYSLSDPTGAVVRDVTSAVESEDGRLWLGSLHHNGVQAVDLVPILQELVAAGKGKKGGLPAEAWAGAGQMLQRFVARRAAAAAARAAAGAVGAAGRAPRVVGGGNGGAGEDGHGGEL